MPLEKIPAILLVGYGVHISVTVPVRWTPKNERRNEDAVEINWLVIVMQVSNFAPSQTRQLTSTKAGNWMGAIIELCIIVAGIMKTTWSKGVITLFLPSGKHPDCIKLTPTSTFAMALVMLGTAIRYWCYREMGKQFTAHLTLLKNHKLITTGPYSVVRHPSYTGILFTFVGEIIWYTARGSWLRESMIYQMKLSWLFIAPVMFAIIACFVAIPRRIPVEDAILKKEFGKDWDEWAKAVPYRLIPGIL
jgi:protein-S-isoprenylcysteine O-methyltransferase Ste14